MNLLDRLIAFFLRAAAGRPAGRVPGPIYKYEHANTPTRSPKFPKGTEWLCPRCEKVLGVAARDVYSGEVLTRAQWSSPPHDPRRHCGAATVRNNGRDQIYTPTGWVG